MGLTTAQTIQEITRKHLTENRGLMFGQCVTAVGWIGGTVPDCEGIVEIPMTDVAGPGFAVGAALQGRRPIFVVRYQGFMWYNASSLVNYAAKSKQIWGRACPIFIRSLAMEGNGVGHTASSAIHSIFMHMPGMKVASPLTPGEYQEVWNEFASGDDPIYVSEHRRSFGLTEELPHRLCDKPRLTLIAASGGRLNAMEAQESLAQEGIDCDLIHILWLKPFRPPKELFESLTKTRLGLFVDSDFETCGASQSISYELMHQTNSWIHALGLEERSCGVSKTTENITPSPEKIVDRVKDLLARKETGE